MNASLPPRFYELQAFPFQELCCDLMSEEDGVRGCHIYGKNGQKQFGIDLEARLGSGRCHVGQCKAYELFGELHLREAIDEFLLHLAHWKRHGVERFILFVGSGVEDSRVWDAARVQEARFELEGLIFDLWDSREIARRLHPHRAIVERRCRHGWAEIICGPQAPPTVTGVSVADTSGTIGAIASAALILELGDLRHRELDEIRELVRSGREQSGEERLMQMRNTASWTALPPNVRAQAVRMRVSLALNRRHDMQEATTILAEARSIDPAANYTLAETLLALHRDGVNEALEKITAPSTTDEWNLRLALLNAADRTAELQSFLDAPSFSPNAETWRLKALVALQGREIGVATYAISKALEIAPAWRLVRETAAIIDYFTVLSPAMEPWKHFEWPIPPDWHLIKRDALSVAALKRAENRFNELLASVELTDPDRQRLQSWRFACIANDVERQAEAGELAQKLLNENAAHWQIVVWALARGYEFVIEAPRAALQRRCAEPSTPIDAVQALLASWTIVRPGALS